MYMNRDIIGSYISELQSGKVSCNKRNIDVFTTMTMAVKNKGNRERQCSFVPPCHL